MENILPRPTGDLLEEIIGESTDTIKKREASTFDLLSTPYGDSLVLFGAGGLGRRTLAGLRTQKIAPRAFADNNRSLWGKTVDGLIVLSPDEAATKYGSNSTFVITIWGSGGGRSYDDTLAQLKSLHCARIVSFIPLYWKYPDIFLPFYTIDAPHRFLGQLDHIRNAFALWSDDASRLEYLAQVKFRAYGNFGDLSSPVSHAQYFPDDLYTLSNNEVFIDCGAYTGDTIQALLERYPRFHGRIFAFEPDPKNFNSLTQYIATQPAQLQALIRAFPLAVGKREEIVHFAATGTDASQVDSAGALPVHSNSLDALINDSEYMYIKMDIEGSELEALQGAERLIMNNEPILAISAYHKADHLWRIPLFIRSLSDTHRFFLRPHNAQEWDLVCYAVPVKRLKHGAIATR